MKSIGPVVELGCISEQRDPTAALASPPPAPQEKSDLEKCTHVKSNPLQFGGLFMYDEGGAGGSRGRSTCNFCRERLYLVLAAGRPGGRRDW